MTTTIARIQNLSRSSTSLGGTDPILLDGEWSIANAGSSAPIIKVGDGVRHWSALPALMSNAPDYVAGPTVTLAPGSPATVVIDNTAVPPVISFGIPAGADGSSAPGGADTDVQYRNGGSFAGDARFTFAQTTGTVTINNGKMVIVSVASAAALQITGSAGQPAVIVGAGTGGHTVENNGGPAGFNNNGLPLMLLNHSSGGYSTIQNDAAGLWSIGYTSGSGSALGTPIVQWNAAGAVNIPRPTTGTTLVLTAKTGFSGLAIDVTAGGCNGVQLNPGGGFNAAFGQTVAGAAYVGAIGAGSVLQLGAASGTGDITIAADHGTFTVGAVGGSKGSGTINAKGYYIDGVLFTGVNAANPTAQVGTAAINGVAVTYMRSDAAPAINQAMAPTWTGAHTFADVATTPVTINGTATTVQSLKVSGPMSTSLGVLSVTQTAGTGPAFVVVPSGNAPAIDIAPTTGTTSFSINVDPATSIAAIAAFGASSILQLGTVGAGDLTIAADHGIYTVGATGGSKGSGTINAKDYYNDGVLLTTALAGNPTALVGTAAINGSAATLMRSDAAPAVNLAMVPTWTARHTFHPSSADISVAVVGTSTTLPALQVACASGSYAIGIDNTVGGNAVVITANASGPMQLVLGQGSAGGAYLTASGTGSTLSLGAAGGSDVLIAADHGIVTAGAVGGSKGSGTINVHSGVYVDGTQIVMPLSGVPTTKVGTAAVVGGATTWMRSDAAPAIDQALNAAWTGNHSFSQTVTAASITLSGGSGAILDDSPSTYGSITVSSFNTGFAGIQFKNSFGANGRTLMVSTSAALQGFYDSAASAWDWYFSAGVLTAGTVPTTQVTGVLPAAQLPGMPISAKTTAYTLAAGDHNTCISITTGGVTSPNGLAVGFIASIYNDSASTQTITQGASLTLRQSGTTNTGNRTLAARGTCTIFYKATNEAIASGDVT